MSENPDDPVKVAPARSTGREGEKQGDGVPRRTLPLAVAALGVVFGDIGTSPLYAFKQCMASGSSPAEVFGIISLILWSLIILVSVKYAGIMLRADNHGEGGIFALLSLAFPDGRDARDGRGRRSRRVAVITAFGILGAALLYGDGVITPAISVLSAVEGLNLLSPSFAALTVPLTVVILLALFAVQRNGSGAVGRVFGGVMLLWFLTIAVLGVTHVAMHPQILGAINPCMAGRYLITHAGTAAIVLGSVFLAVTGCEALYADLGHFGRVPIQLAWNFLVLPALALNYLGQGALMITSHGKTGNPFFQMAPGALLLPLVVLATVATIIASQALICGVFSLTMQAIRMNYLPRMNILHTNETESGQIYVPFVNTALAAACIGLVIGFRSSAGLASAYGVAVTLTMLATTTLFYFASQRIWKWPAWRAAAVCGLFALVELIFFASNALKIVHGGWLPLLIGALLYYLMTTWRMGSEAVVRQLASPPLRKWIASLSSRHAMAAMVPRRAKGTAIFLTGLPGVTPIALYQNVKHNHVLHERNIVLTIITGQVPRCKRCDRLEVKELPDGFHQLTAHFGFMENPTIREVLACAKADGLSIDLKTATFFLSGLHFVATGKKSLPKWREGAFIFMSQAAQKASAHFRMPSDRTIELDAQMEL